MRKQTFAAVLGLGTFLVSLVVFLSFGAWNLQNELWICAPLFLGLLAWLGVEVTG